MAWLRATTIPKPLKTTVAWESIFSMHLKIHSNNHNNTTIWHSFSSNSFHNNKIEETWIIQKVKTEGIFCMSNSRGQCSQEVVPHVKVSQHKIKIIKVRVIFQIVKTFRREWWLQLLTLTTIKIHLVRLPTSPIEHNLVNKVVQTINLKVKIRLKKTKQVNYSKIMNKLLGKKNRMEFKIVMWVKILIWWKGFPTTTVI